MAVLTSTEMIYMVSFEVDENGSLKGYSIDEKDLAAYRADIADNLKSMFGKGIFHKKEEARQWAEAQIEAGASQSCCGKSGGCCRQHK